MLPAWSNQSFWGTGMSVVSWWPCESDWMGERSTHQDCPRELGTHLPAMPSDREVENNILVISCSEVTQPRSPRSERLFKRPEDELITSSLSLDLDGWAGLLLHAKDPGCSKPLCPTEFDSAHARTSLASRYREDDAVPPCLLIYATLEVLSLINPMVWPISLSWKTWKANRMAHISNRLMWSYFSSWDHVSEAKRPWRWTPHPSIMSENSRICRGIW